MERSEIWKRSSAVASAEMATGGELVFAEQLRRWQERRRAAVAAGSE